MLFGGLRWGAVLVEVELLQAVAGAAEEPGQTVDAELGWVDLVYCNS